MKEFFKGMIPALIGLIGLLLCIALMAVGNETQIPGISLQCNEAGLVLAVVWCTMWIIARKNIPSPVSTNDKRPPDKT